MKLAAISIALVTLSGCATVADPIPTGYSGAVVRLADSGYQESAGKGRFFVATALNGKTIENSIRETRSASFNQGFDLSSRYTSRNIPVAPVRVTLLGTHQTAAPIHEFASRMAGTFFSVEGSVDLVPLEGRAYLVNGELAKQRSCVWIEEAESKAVVTERVCK